MKIKIFNAEIKNQNNVVVCIFKGSSFCLKFGKSSKEPDVTKKPDPIFCKKTLEFSIEKVFNCLN